ncbi:unnamed protein product [Prorocentrum cordatum]|uniref:Sel1 repeat family protein n=1 Tax=Prorocentrum cordatum TaxID=2364126 RepID=A0ABN9WCR0_9DINO|nr:unnamed protein product [Polarella glacialis]
MPPEDVLWHEHASELSPETIGALLSGGAWSVPSVTGIQRSESSAVLPAERENGAALAPTAYSGTERLSKAEAKRLYNLGVRYLRGRGVEPDDREAASCFLRAARSGHSGAQYAFGSMLMEGRGVEADLYTAAEWFGKAGRQGHPGAAYNLATMMLNGIGVQERRD